MNPLSQVAFGLILVILLNMVVMRFTDLWKRAWLFWLLQAFNAAIGLTILIVGLPLVQDARFTWVIGGLFVVRIFFNIAQWVNLRSEEREKAREAEYQRLQSEIAALNRQDGEQEEE